MAKKQTSLRVEEQLLKDVRRLGKRSDRSDSNLIEFLLKRALVAYEKQLDRVDDAIQESVKLG